MSKAEEVVKYKLQFVLDRPPYWEGYPSMESWRRVLFNLRLIGLDPSRYGGLAYGNVSQRLGGISFVISATQTGGMAQLEPRHYCLVEHAELAANFILARGRYPPSSEALTHAAVYQACLLE
ncbi:MAG: class II aldolase/adducin family protein [Methylohalobius sp.]|nr:class II aldolase/adducin family protein [Methylohalobius sp.]